MAAGYKESTVERYLVLQARLRRGVAVKQQGRRGWPDRLVVLPHATMWLVETKRPKGGRYEPLQLRTHRRLRAMGHTVVLCKTKEDVDQMFKDMGL